MSLVDVTKLYLYAPAEEQLAMLRKLLHGLSRGGVKLDETLWIADRAKILWLWDWESEGKDTKVASGTGVIGKIPKQELEEEILQCMIESGCLELAINLYLKTSTEFLPRGRVEQIVLMKAMEAYDSASNGNRTRGGIKKANDM